MQKWPIGAMLVSLYTLFLFLSLASSLVNGFIADGPWPLGIASEFGYSLGVVVLLPAAISLFMLKRISIYFYFTALTLFILTSISGLTFTEISQGPIAGWVIALGAIFYLRALARKGVLT